MRFNDGVKSAMRWVGVLGATFSLLVAGGCGSSGSNSGTQQQQQQQPTQLQASNDPTGQLQTTSTTGGVDFTNAFFKDLGTNGRDCFTCHKPTDGWSISAADVNARFQSSAGTDEIFRTVDGSNCPNDDVSTLAAKQTAYSLLTERGVIRVSRPIPANAEFSLFSVDDPYNCVATNGLSLYRRPLPATNLKFETTIMFDARETFPGLTLFQDLESQANDATLTHAQGSALMAQQKQAIVSFELSTFTAQQVDAAAGDLSQNGGQGGVKALAAQQFTPGGNNFVAGAGFNQNVFTLYTAWENLTGTDPQSLARESIARGEKIFNTRVVSIFGVAGLNDTLKQTTIVGSCSTCHSTPNIGDMSVNNPQCVGFKDSVNSCGPLNIGTENPDRRASGNGQIQELPLYTFNCTSGPLAGTFPQVMDPGFALTSGLCNDIGKFKVPGLRGLAARAPYFHDGQAATLNDVVDFYNTRFNIKLTPQEQADLVNFLNSL